MSITNIDKTAPTASVSYNITTATNGSVIATITANEAVQDVSGWTKSSNGKVLTKTYTSNASENVTIKDIAGNTATVAVSIANIDKTAPTATVGYSTTDPTSGSVTATITANEAVQDVSGWTKSSNGKVLTKTYATNTNENVTIKDIAGNTTTVSISISNIDKTGLNASVSYNTTDPTNGNVIVTITANKAVQDVSGWTKSSNGTILTKTYTTNKSEEITIKDQAENTTTVTVSVTNIDKTAPTATVSYSSTTETNGSVIVTITADEVLKDVNGWIKSSDGTILTKTYTANTNEDVIVEDLAGNTTGVNISINNILVVISGDLNNNNKIDVGDVLILQRHIAQQNSSVVANKHPEWKLSDERVSMGDFNHNNRIDVGDVVVLQRYIAAKNDSSVANAHPSWLEI